MCCLGVSRCCKDQHFYEPKISVEKFLKKIIKNLIHSLTLIFSFAGNNNTIYCIVFIYRDILTLFQYFREPGITFSIIFDK